MARLGQNVTNAVYMAWSGGFTTKSDYARANADHVAIAASLGLITTHIAGPTFGRTWLVTAKGLTLLEERTNHEML